MTSPFLLEPNQWTPPLVLLVGMGNGVEDLSARARKWIDHAEVLFGARRYLELFAARHAARVPWESPLERSLDRIEEVSARQRTAVLTSGDPFFFGVGRRITARLGKDRVLAFPNVTAVQTLFARIGESWDNVKVMSLHGRPGSAGSAAWLREVRLHPRVVLYTDPEHSPDRIARWLLEAGLGECTLVVGEDLGMPSERISRISVEEAVGSSFSALNVVAVLREDSNGGLMDPVDPWPLFGLPESAYAHEAGMITKMEVRAVVLAHLQLKPGLVLWDLGAASGSVAIEAARTMGLGRTVAIERSERRYRDLLQNIARLAPSRAQAVCGRALEHIEALPDPDRVFIGGSGGELEDLLAVIADRLRPGGLVVQTAVSLDTVETSRAFWKSRPDFSLQLLQMQVSHSAPIGRTERLEPQNPVFLLKALSLKRGE